MSCDKTILIDTPKNGWSHMVSDDVKHLHEFAESIGLKRHWFENKRGKNQPHYDIKESFFDLAISNGATLVTRKELFIFLQKNFNED